MLWPAQWKLARLDPSYRGGTRAQRSGDDSPSLETFEANWSRGVRSVLLVYADWCGHCQSLVPTWNGLVERAPEHVRFYALESTEDQDHPFVQEAEGYPTMKTFDGDGFVDRSDLERDARTLGEAFFAQPA